MLLLHMTAVNAATVSSASWFKLVATGKW